MIHGVTDIGLSWTTLTWKLQDDYDIYMVDTRSHGLSDPRLFEGDVCGDVGVDENWDSLSKIPVPVLILKADASPEAREAHQKTVGEMPRVKLVHIDGAGHNLHHDQLERTMEVLKEFLSTL